VPRSRPAVTATTAALAQQQTAGGITSGEGAKRKGAQRSVRCAGLAVSGAVDAEGRAYLWGFNENSQLAKVQWLLHCYPHGPQR